MSHASAGPALRVLLTMLAVVACSQTGRHDARTGDSPAASLTNGDTAMVPFPATGSPVLIAVGDIADCRSDADEATAALVDSIAGTVAVPGDNAYEDGSVSDYASCYAPM